VQERERAGSMALLIRKMKIPRCGECLWFIQIFQLHHEDLQTCGMETGR
jgi:hypothetical protein